MTELVITVYGTPAPQGSKRHVGNGVMVESSKKVKPWREDVRAAALAICGHQHIGPLVISIIFTLPRPKGHYRTGRNAHLIRDGAPPYPAGRPDLDKLVRSTLDALGSAGVYGDDSQIVHILAHKRYAGEDGALDRPGACIRLATAVRLLRDAGYGSGEEAG